MSDSDVLQALQTLKRCGELKDDTFFYNGFFLPDFVTFRFDPPSSIFRPNIGNILGYALGDKGILLKKNASKEEFNELKKRWKIAKLAALL